MLRRFDDECELEDLHVIPDMWGSGVAKELINATVEAMRTMHSSRAVLWVGEDNPRARRFYEREGWENECVSRPSSFGPIELRYGKALSPSAPH